MTVVSLDMAYRSFRGGSGRLRHPPQYAAFNQSGSVQNLSHIWSGDGFDLRDLRLIERPHVHVALGGPGSSCDVSQPRRCEVEARLAVRECTHNTSPPTNLSHDPLKWIVGADLVPMDVGEGIVGQRLVDAALDQISRSVHPGSTQVFDDRLGFAVGGVAVLLGMDCLEHMAHLANPGRRNVAEDVEAAIDQVSQEC